MVIGPITKTSVAIGPHIKDQGVAIVPIKKKSKLKESPEKAGTGNLSDSHHFFMLQCRLNLETRKLNTDFPWWY